MVSNQAKEKATRLLQSFFGVAFFNNARMQYIFNAVKNLDDSQFLRLVDEALVKEIRPGVNWFSDKAFSANRMASLDERWRSKEPEPDQCKLCGDIGVVFVKTVKEGSKSLAMQCTCDCAQSKLNFWELPKYSADFCMIDFPYSMKELKDKMTLNEVAAIFKKHMKHSKKIWDGEE